MENEKGAGVNYRTGKQPFVPSKEIELHPVVKEFQAKMINGEKDVSICFVRGKVSLRMHVKQKSPDFGIILV